MDKRKLLTIFMALALAAGTSGCVGSVTPIPSASQTAPTESAAPTTPDTPTTDESSVQDESSEEESSEEESSEEESEEESSEEESSEEESEEESSEEESSEEESEEESSSEESQAAANGAVIKFTKPDNWDDEVYAYVYELNSSDDIKNAPWPGEIMTNNGDGTYSYTVPDDIANAVVIFNDGKKQYPRNKGLEVVDGKEYDNKST